METAIRHLDTLERLLALLSLALGLVNAGTLLGVGGGELSPTQVLGGAAFTLLAVFTVARFFAGVGLWIRASWGAVVLLGTGVAELFLMLFSDIALPVSFFGILMRLVLLGGAGSILFLVEYKARQAAHD